MDSPVASRGLMSRMAKAACVALIVMVMPAWALAEGESVVIPAGTVLRVKLRTTLTSKTSKSGDKWTGVIEQPVTANGREVLPPGSVVDGHVAFVKPSKRIKGKAEMRIVLDKVTTPGETEIALAAALDDTNGAPCAKTGGDEEGTIEGCGKSKKDMAKDAAIGGAMGASAGATVGLGSMIDCSYFGNCGGPGIGQATLYGAGIGAATAVIYNIFKHTKQLVLVPGMHLTFVISHTVEAPEDAPESESSTESSAINR